MPDGRSTRRTFLAAAGGAAVLALGMLGGCGGSGGGGPVEIFALSARGRRISRAAKKHDANKRFRTFDLADAGRAHPGDKSQVVSLMVSEAEFRRLFARNPFVADLRHL